MQKMLFFLMAFLALIQNFLTIKHQNILYINKIEVRCVSNHFNDLEHKLFENAQIKFNLNIKFKITVQSIKY